MVAGADHDRRDQRQRQQREQPRPRAPRASTRRPWTGRFATGQVGHQPVEVGVRLGRHAGVETFLELVAVEAAV